MRGTIRAWVLLILIISFITSTIIADFNINEIDYIRPENASVTIGGGLWANNFIKTKAVFPLSQMWKTHTGKTDNQPIIIDDVVFITAENSKLTALRKYDGKPLGSINITQDNPNYSVGNLFAIKKDKGLYQLVLPLNDGVITSWDVQINYNVENKPINAIYTRAWDYDFTMDNIVDDNVKNSKLITKYISLLKEGSNLYLGFGTYSGHVVVLNSKTGNLIINGDVEYSGTIGMGVPYKNFNSIIMPQSDDMGVIIKGTVVNGVLNMSFNTDIIHEDNLVSPTAYTVIKNPVDNQSIGMLILQDGKGTIIGYNTSYNEVLFKINKYEGRLTVSGLSIAEKHILATLTDSGNNKSKILCVDFEKAIIDGYDNEDKIANSSIIFEENLNGTSYGSALALQIVDQENQGNNIKETVYREVFIAADRSTENNLKIYYMDQYNASTKRPIPMPYSFRKTVDNKSITADSLTVENGIATPLSYASGYLILGDGKGNILAYTAKEENNLALVNFHNSEDKVAMGKTYIAKVDVINYTMKNQKEIPIEFYINDTIIHSSKIDIPDDGLTVNFQYTVPKEYPYDELKIDAKLNMIEPRKLEEIDYDDNIQSLILDVMPMEIDLEAKSIQQTSPVPADSMNTAKATIVNHSEQDLENVLVHYKLNGKQIGEERIEILSKKTIERYFNWQAPNFDTNAILSVVVDPKREIEDINRDNNTVTKTVKVNKSKAIFISCNDNNPFESPPYSWVYRVEPIYRNIYDYVEDKDGKLKRVKVGEEFTGRYDQYWTSDTTKYTERLTLKTDVNTGQQYEDSRGGWEILPYTNHNIEKAKRTTRSGYGIELKVTATYRTSPAWETPPSGWTNTSLSYPWDKEPRQRYGDDWLKGLTNTRAIAHLPNGKTVEMQRIQSQSNKYSVTWQLPEIYYTPKGLSETWRGRFFAMGPRTPDGKYDFYVEVFNVGETNMRCQVRDYIEIYGDVWRDTNIKRKSN